MCLGTERTYLSLPTKKVRILWRPLIGRRIIKSVYILSNGKPTSSGRLIHDKTHAAFTRAVLELLQHYVRANKTPRLTAGLALVQKSAQIKYTIKINSHR